MSFVACVEDKEKLHIVRFVGKAGFLSGAIIAYCDAKFSLDVGTVQLPARILGATTLPATTPPAREIVPCDACRERAK